METDRIYRILDALETFRNGSIPHEATDPEQAANDAETIRARYDEIKWQMSFAEAARLAKAEFMVDVLEAE